MKQAAIKYFNAGLTVFPTGEDKQPIKGCMWRAYEVGQTMGDIDRLFSNPHYGIGLVCGVDGLEVIDIDTKNDLNRFADDKSLRFETRFFAELKNLMPDVIDKVVIQRTQSGGWHLIYKCPNPSGNKKLAKLLGVKESILETRGKGGYIMLAPSPHYSIIKNDILNVPYITGEERNNLIAICQSFDQQVKPKFDNDIKRNLPAIDGQKTAWQDYNERANVLDNLINDGWKVCRESAANYYLTRPNKDSGISASIRKADNIFYCFTSSTQFEPNTAYSPFAVYAFLAHSGDFSEAARVLYKDGYGERIEAKLEAIKSKPIEPAKQKEQKQMLDSLDSVKFDYYQPIEERNTILNIELKGDKFKIAGLGNLVVIAGGQKSRKSTVGNALIGSALSGQQIINFSLSSLGKKILAFDTEQPFERFQKTQHRLFKVAQKTGNLDNYSAYALRGFSKPERLAAIEQKIYATENLGIVLLDGIVDLVEDYNDLKESSAIVERLMRWTDEKQILLIVILHLTKTTSQLRGHLGTELQNKADAVIETAKSSSEGWTDVCCRESREIPFPPFQFTQDSSGLPVTDLSHDVDWKKMQNHYQQPDGQSETPDIEVPF